MKEKSNPSNPSNPSNLSILAIVAHPDDELLGCGGTLFNHVMRGDEVNILILSKGREIYDFSQLGEMTRFNYLVEDFPPQKFHNHQIEINKKVKEISEEISPDIVYTHYSEDLQEDHRIIYQSSRIAFRNYHKSIMILSFEILSNTEYSKDVFFPNYYENISGTIELKKKSLEFYDKEMKNGRDYQSIQIKSQSRGLESNLKFAEAFKVVSIINK